MFPAQISLQGSLPCLQKPILRHLSNIEIHILYL